MQRILVSGVGRSATTLIYRQVGQLLLTGGQAVNFRYEPYLWDIRAPRMKGQSFGPGDLSHAGLDTHLNTPLFLDGPGDPRHDAFLDSLFDAPFDGDRDRRPDASLAKVIRGAGRLRAGLERFADLQVIACLRNPVDTINSGLGMFSFFGEEFHSDDRPRFKAELLTRPPVPGLDAAALPDGRRSIEWSAAWVAAFTAEMCAVARDYPSRVHLVCHEALTADPVAALEAIAAFLGRPGTPEIHLGAKIAAGPKAGAVNLTVADMDHLQPFFARYCRDVLEPALGSVPTQHLAAALPDRYGSGSYRLPIAGADAGLMGTALHEMMLMDQVTPFVKIMQRPPHPTDLAALIDDICDSPGAATWSGRPSFRPHPEAAALKAGRSFGVVVTSYNSGLLAVDAVLSCLQQTVPFDEIVVVDDCSTDDSAALLAELELRFAQVILVRLDTNLGPAAARHIGFTRAGTDFITQLDGDDLYWPTKLEGEARVLDGDPTRVAFSDVLLAESPTRHLLEDTALFYGSGTPEALYGRLLSREGMIPRDLTFARDSYFAVGGYDLTGSLYEDWEFKLRLAALPGHRWVRSGGFAGTVYNRSAPGLSHADLDRQARALVTVFLRAQRPALLPVDRVLPAFDNALRRVARRPMTRAVRRWLLRLIEEDRFDPVAVADFGRARWLRSLSGDAFRRLFAELAVTGAAPPRTPPAARPRNRPILNWKPRDGWQSWAGAEESPPQVALKNDSGTCAIGLSVPVSGFCLRIYPGESPLRLNVRVDGQSHEQQVVAAGPGRLVPVEIPLPLGSGPSIVHITLPDPPVTAPDPDRPRLVLGGIHAAEDT